MCSKECIIYSAIVERDALSAGRGEEIIRTEPSPPLAIVRYFAGSFKIHVFCVSEVISLSGGNDEIQTA